MTDTGQVPGEGLPENAGMVEQPGVPAPGAYTYLSEPTAEDEDLLLLPGAQGAWGNEVAPPVPVPVVEAVHEPGPHETSGRDSGSVDLSAVRMSTSAPQPPVARRPLHLGPPTPDGAGSPVRSLADRGPAGAPAAAFPVRHAAPAAPGPEYLDAPRDEIALQGASPWGARAQVQVAPPVAQVVSEGTPAETVFPEGAGAYAGAPVTAGAAPVAQAPDAQTSDAGAGPSPAESQEVPAPPEQAAEAPAAEQAPGAPQAQGHDASGADPVHEVSSAQSVVEPTGGAGADDPAVAPAAVPVPETPQAAEQAPEEAAEQAYVPPQPELLLQPPAPDQPAGVAQPAEAVPAPEAVQFPEPVLVQDYAQAPQLADGSLFPQAPEGGLGPEYAQALPDFPHAPQPAPFPAAPAAVHFAHPSEDEAGPYAAEAPVAPTAEDAPQHPEYEAPVPQSQDTAAPFAEAGPQAGFQQPQPQPQPQPQSQPSEAEPVAAEAAQVTAQVQDTAEAPQFAAPVEPGVPAEAVEPQVGADPSAGVPDPAQPVQPGPAVHAEAPAPPADQTSGDASQGEQAQLQDDFQAAPEQPAGHPGQADPADPADPAAQVGQFVPVEGTVPTTPHLAPTPPHGMPVTPLPEEPAEQTGEDAAAPPTAPVEQLAPEPAPEPVAESAPEPALAPVPAAGPDTASEDELDDEPILVLPAPREPAPAPGTGTLPVHEAADDTPEPVAAQQAEDLDTRAADQEESTAAVAQTRESTGPAAPGYDDAEREAVLRVMRERRDIRNGFRSDPIPHDVLLRVLEAAHTAPSVGHSQPWDFVVIRSAETRRSMHELAARQREAYAKSLPKGRAKQFKELKIEAILDTPVNIVVTADPTRGGRHTLGRHTQPQMAPYSSALAVENLWLAARAEGLGVGWVSFFDEREMVRGLGLPEHLEVVAYLCVGYVDEFPDEPELMQSGWSKRRPLSWVVHEETYGRRALPGEEPHDLLAETITNIRPLDAKALGEAWERQKRMTKPAGALGMLEIISAQLSGLSRMCPPPIPEPAAVAIFAGDHGVHAQGVTPWPQEVTGQMVANILGGGAVCNAFAAQVGAEVCVVDVGVASDLPATPGLLPRKVRAGTADMTTGPALTREEVRSAIEVGIETARDLVAAGNKALITGEMGIANTTASAALISVYTGSDPAEVTGRGTGINDETLARKTEVVRRALELHQPDPADPIGVLSAIGGLEHAAMVGLLLGGASLRTPVILDGVSAGAAALVARAIAPEVLAACIAGHRSAEPGHVAALNKLGLRPLVDLDLRLGEGTGALLALPVVQSAARAMHEVATFDSAGVTEK
ncbi:5,6-dimethylbenzimidazole synthase [Streptomyces dioscori]|uniref:Nicotinate-nucleotide--dimethylbenzimidazole phosphoribosyltransferase n=1 Tax=Streptomyces dioscori TaxID=2109333 RepID=A0A2P8Q0S8_9ACTN|nr:nicotinate-nucleotide--dimethylbenzimidazole phosphoribosyltransferase [Streptomyces dioscori]PSM39859.1 5,6-dimethylbenzimidazole synthase [Streptomyces dioscori]